jgi:hypothetical protein
MKNRSLMLLVFMASLGACNKSGRVRDFAQGVFVNSSGGDYSLAQDTLAIVAEDEHNYKVYRRTGYQLLNKGKAGKHQFAKETWQTVFDQGTGMMTELRKGRQIIFYPDSGYLLIGRRKYLKIHE